MDMQDRQYIGILANDDEKDGRSNVFINKGLYIQYKIKSLLLPQENPNFVFGFISSFEDESVIRDDEYSFKDDRINNFREAVEDKLFVYSYKVSDSGHANILSRKANLVKKPLMFSKDMYFYSIPVFTSKNSEIVCEWEEEKSWKLFREYETQEEFMDFLKNKKSVGRTFGYNTEPFMPSFIVWMDNNGDMFAIGHLIDSRQNTKGGLIIECDKIVCVNINEYKEFWVYQGSLNPTIMFIPEDIYAKIEDSLLKLSAFEKINIDNEQENLGDIDISLKNTTGRENTSIETIQRCEELIEIDTSIKTDELIIQSMDYYSQKRNLFYDMKDFVNLHTAVKCNSLVILSGLSGTGKSAIVDIYARALGISDVAGPEETRKLFIPVRPSWNDDSDLLGYVDLVHMVYRASDSGFVDFLVRSQKDENKDKLFIVCFDEMNLARVEHYFSQFLSLLERPVNDRELQLYDKQYSGRLYNSTEYPSRIKIGDNVKFIGTVNIDESTYHFSDKVLDRANIIQLEIIDYSKEWEKKKYGSLVNVVWSMDNYNSITVKNSDENMDAVHQLLWKIHLLLHSVNAKYGIGPRIVKNIDMYLWNLPKTNIGNFSFSEGIDLQIAQRVLTKVRGPENQLGEILGNKGNKNFNYIFDEYKSLSDFKKSREIVLQKQKELESYGYCI